jgi:hypothetical protein
MNDYILFSIDQADQARELKKFLHYFDNLVAMKEASFIESCIGLYEGKLENSFLVTEKDFKRFLLDSDVGYLYISQQEAFLLIKDQPYGKMLAFEVRNGDRVGETTEPKYLGEFVSVPKEVAFKSNGFTYRPSIFTYWVIKNG